MKYYYTINFRFYDLFLDGSLLGALLGALLGTLLGALLGTLLSALLGALLGTLLGALLGTLLGTLLSALLGSECKSCFSRRWGGYTNGITSVHKRVMFTVAWFRLATATGEPHAMFILMAIFCFLWGAAV